MKAGRQMDALMAEKVMEWKRYEATVRGERVCVLTGDRKSLYTRYVRSQSDPGGWEETTGPLTSGEGIPHYSTKMDPAWEVGVKMRDEDETAFGRAFVAVVPIRDTEFSTTGSTSLVFRYLSPLTLCLAAFEMKGVTVRE